jgi:GT2 family glycosyltransferase
MSEITPRVAVLILGYNDQENLFDAIGSACQQSYKNYEVFFIDNASKDNSIEYVKENFPEVKVIVHQTNIGYAGAYEKVLTKVFNQNFDAAVLLNSDVRVDKDWLHELTRSAYAHKNIGFAQPKIFLWGDKSTLANTFGNEIHYLGFGFCGHYEMEDNETYKSDREITYASGASLFVKRDAYLDVGGIDGTFFAYLEDQDLVWRGHLFGWKAVLSAKSIMWHKYVFKNPTRSRWKFHIYERNRLFFIIKNYSALLILLIAPMFLIMEIGLFFNALFKGYFLDKLRAYRDTFLLLPMLLKKREWIQKNRKVSDQQLFPLFRSEITFKELKNPLLDAANFIFSLHYKLIGSVLTLWKK